VDHDKGRHLYNIQPEVGIGRIESRSRREESIITRLRSNREMPALYSFRNCGAYFISVHKVQ